MTGFNLKDFRPGPTSAQDPHSWDISSEKLTPASSEGEEIQVPDLAIFQGISLPPASYSTFTTETLVYPAREHLAAHLLLVECFHKLKSDVITSSSLDEVLCLTASNSHLKWNLFVKAAVSRFELWWQSIQDIVRHAKAYTSHGGAQAVDTLTKEYLPPLDVLLVWYSYILHPSYAADCTKLRKQSIFALCFPWNAVYEMIDRKSLAYDLPKPAAILFKKMTSQETDLISCLTLPPPYTEAADPQYSVDLEQTVLDLNGFIDETHKHLWIRSPACSGSLARSITRYQKLLSVVNPNLGPKHNYCRPPWDIELVLKTHSLYPLNFRNTMDKLFGREPGQTLTRRLYEDLHLAPDTQSNMLKDTWEGGFRTPYCVCFCWRCECVKNELDSREASASDLSQKQVKEIQERLQFYVSVEKIRETGGQLPANPYKVKEAPEEKWEVDMGPAYYEVVVPPKYDRRGKLVKGEQRKTVREKSYTSRINWMVGS